MSRWIEGTVVKQKAWTETLFSIFVKAPIEPFIPGQFTQIGVRVEEEIVFRPYSFANSSDDPILEFYYNVSSEGQLTPMLMRLKSGDPISIARKPAGRFTLEPIPKVSDLWLLATGTGLGVFLSLLQSHLLWEKFSNVVLAHSVRFGIELTHWETIRRIAKDQGERFRYIPIVTREEVPDAFNQRLPVLIQLQTLEQKAGLMLIPACSHVMLCGNPLMVKEVVAMLAKKGFELHHPNQAGHITVESYWKEKSNTLS